MLQTDTTGNNCLTLAIENSHKYVCKRLFVHNVAHLTLKVIFTNILLYFVKLYREAALAILSDEEQGLDAPKCVENESTTPLRLLIKKMPGEINAWCS